MFTKLLRRWRGLPEHPFQVGDIVTSPYATDEFEKVIEIRPSSWKGIDVRVEINEPFKFFNRPGSDRTDWIAYDCSNCVGVGVSLPEAFTEKCPLCEVGTLRPK